MSKIEKKKLLGLAKADAAADIDLINQHSMKELQPGEVFCFSLILCDNEVDRDYERFTDATLRALAPLFLGKTGICDHDWTANKQVARLYRCEAVKTGEKNSLGEDKLVLRGDAYMLRNEKTEKLISDVEGGIVKEVSVGCAVKSSTCSICGEPVRWGTCKSGHQAGKRYDDALCFGNLSDPTDAYEFSFVAVPSQRGAGVTKSAKDPDNLLDSLMAADLGECDPDKIKALVRKGQEALLSAEDRRKRAEIIARYARHELKG